MAFTGVAFSNRYTVFNIVISDVDKRFSSTLIIFVTSNHVEDKRKRGLHLYIRRDYEGELGRKRNSQIKCSRVPDHKLDPLIYQSFPKKSHSKHFS